MRREIEHYKVKVANFHELERLARETEEKLRPLRQASTALGMDKMTADLSECILLLLKARDILFTEMPASRKSHGAA